MDIIKIIAIANALGIRLTNAKLGSEICQAWCDRVEQAQRHFDHGEMAACEEMIEAANQYAI